MYESDIAFVCNKTIEFLSGMKMIRNLFANKNINPKKFNI